MIRYTLLWLFVFGLMGYAWKDWRKALAVLILMLAVLERRDMPKTIFGIQGLNPFNLTLAGILVAWLADVFRNGWRWDVPRWFTLTLVAYLTVTLVAFYRLIVDPGALVDPRYADFGVIVYSTGGLISDFLINTFKWVLPGLLLLQGCRTAEHRRWAVVCTAAMYVILALQVVKQIPPHYLLDGEALQQRAADILQRRVGYHRVDLATMFAGAAWAMIAARQMFTSTAIRVVLLGCAGMITLGLASTGGRTGYATWCIIGLVFALVRYRSYLLLLPIALVGILTFAPGIAERMTQGFGTEESLPAGGDENFTVEPERDDYLITSGRSEVWPIVIEKIRENPWFGYGRQAMARTDLRVDIAKLLNEFFNHPHNAYLEFTLDNGLIGLAVVVIFFGGVMVSSLWMFARRRTPELSAAGGMTLAMVLSFLIAAVGAQTFYPTEGVTGLWCLMAVGLRAAWDREPLVATVATVPVPSPPPAPKASMALWPKGRGTSPKTQRLGRAPLAGVSSRHVRGGHQR